MCELKKSYGNGLKVAKNKQFKPPQSIPKQHSKTETPLLLRGFDSMLKNYILAMSNHATVISQAIANSDAKTLMKKYLAIIGEFDLNLQVWLNFI